MEADVSNEDEKDTELKRQFQEHAPKKIKALRFGILSNQDIISQSVVEVYDRHLYDNSNSQRSVTAHGPLDQRLGTSIHSEYCHTCNEPLSNCNGHFGHIKLALPVFHVGYMKKIIQILNCICKDCARILLLPTTAKLFLKSFRRPNLDGLQLKQLSKKLVTECRKSKQCPHCGSTNGVIKKVANHPLKVIHDKYRWYWQSKTKSKKMPESLEAFNQSFEAAKNLNPELEKHLKKAVEDLNPLKVLNLFRKITASDCELLAMKPNISRPEMLIWQLVPVPPVSIRPSVHQDTTSTEDDLTNKLGDVVHVSNLITEAISKGQTIQLIMERWEYLQIQVAMYVNSDTPNLLQGRFGKPIRSLVQRVKGKQGRFRGNLSGKRVDFSARTVISPDPNLAVDEVAVPEREAVNLTYPEVATSHNIEKLRACIIRGKKYPGANFVWKKVTGRRIALAVLARSGDQKLRLVAERLQIGDVVHRHLEDGDLVLFNRQPSLHKLSIMCHRVQVKDWRTFRLNECACTPYNADFDGDEMNLHVPQTEEARAEAMELMSVKSNLATPKDGTPIIAAIQDFITAAYLLSNKDRFYDRKSFAQICTYMFDGDGSRNGATPKYGPRKGRDPLFDIDLPEPAILRPERLWTGKQIFTVLMRPNQHSPVKLNFDAACKEYRPNQSQPPDLSEDDTYVCIRNSEIMVGMMDKAVLGSGNKDSIFYVMMRDYGSEEAAYAMSRMAKLAARWLGNEGFSIGISDVFPGSELRYEKESLIREAYEQCDLIIAQCAQGILERDAGCDQEQTMENRITGKLNEVRQKSGSLCFAKLSKENSAILMAKSGAKGSNINVAQMVATVGQQIINGNRVADGFEGRSLPHFLKSARHHPSSKGFVRNSFFSGLTPTEFIFHAMSGREGLVDTAVKTADTGYMSRRLLKSLEDMSCYYDDTIRNSSGSVVQFQYGDDRLDPVDMEGNAKPVNFERTFTHAQTSEWNAEDPSLTPDEVMAYTRNVLLDRRKRLDRIGLNGQLFDYNLCEENENHVDQYESNRRFLDEIEKFLEHKSANLQKAYELVGKSSTKDRAGSRRRNPNRTAQAKHAGLIYGIAKISRKTLSTFLQLCLAKYEKAKVQPGHPVGAIGAQSISEPGTQMTLKTFHFAGVAGMSITQGVPRIREIINASKFISTPVISCQLIKPTDERAARMAKGQIEKTFLKDVIKYISEVWTESSCSLRVKVDFGTVENLRLNISMADIRKALIHARGLPVQETWVGIDRHTLVITLDACIHDGSKTSRSKGKLRDKESEEFIRLQNLKRQLPNVVVKGYPNASRAVIAKKLNTKSEVTGLPEIEILVEGYGLKDCMITKGVNGYKTRTNSVIEAKEVLGIEAARSTIIAEINMVIGTQMDIDPRHMQLLADVMTYKGDVLGITRFGLAKMRDSVLQLASFERTPDHLFDAAMHGKEDEIEGVSECIIMGQSMKVGTGAMHIVRNLAFKFEDFVRKPTRFEEAFKQSAARS